MGIYEAGRICHGQSLAKSESTPGLDKACIPLRYRNGEAGSDKTTLKGRKRNILV